MSVSLCTVEGCEKPLIAQGLCAMHRSRVRRNGTTDLAVPRPRRTIKPPVHGTNRAYQTFGCRCEVCVDANRARARHYYQNYIERVAQKRRAKKYGLAPEEHDRMLAQQGGVCAICRSERPDGKSLYVDHCHATGRVRALLCTQCNTGLGMFEDDPDRMLAAAAYVLQHTDVLGEIRS